MRSARGLLLFLLAACAGAPSLDEARLASASPDIVSCAQWFQALDAEVALAQVRDLTYLPVPGFPYLRADRFLADSRAVAAARPAAFDALAERLLEHDLEARRYEIDNLPAAVVEKWSGMRLDDSRAAAFRRSVQCGRLLRHAELSAPRMRSALLERLALPPSASHAFACAAGSPRSGAVVRFSPPIGALSRAAVAGWLLRAELDPLGQAIIPARELDALAAAYAPGLEVVIASDADRFGALRWRRGATRPEVDATEPAVYVRPTYARYHDRVLLQIVYTLLFPDRRMTVRVTLGPDGEPLVYEASGADGCYAVALGPHAQLRDAFAAASRLPPLQEDERPLIALAGGASEVAIRGVVPASESLARYALREYDELRSGPALEGRNRAAVGRPALDDADRMQARFVFHLPEPRP
jgi:hypothetical protein